MNRPFFQPRLAEWTTPLIVLLSIGLAFLLGTLVAAWEFAPRELVILALAAAGLIFLLAPSETIVRVAFILWLLTFGFGWRTLYLTSSFTIHPLEVLAYLLFVVLIARAVVRRERLDWKPPLPILLLTLFLFMGLLVAGFAARRQDAILQEFKTVFILLPIYYIVRWCVRTRSDWERSVSLLLLVITYVSALGLMDFIAPELSRSLAGSPSVETLYLTRNFQEETFARVGFIFYGNFSAGFLIFTFIGFTVHHFLNHLARPGVKTLIFGLLIGLQLAAIYLSGYRGLWYALIVFTLVYAFLRRRALLLLGFGLLSIPWLPSNFVSRLISVFVTSEADSSQYVRIARARQAWTLIEQSPWTGVGWNGSGYVHADLIQLGANLGVPALAVFVLWWLHRVYSLWRLARRQDWIGSYAASMCASLAGLMVTLSGEGLIGFVQLIAPVWFLVMLSYKLQEFALVGPAVELQVDDGGAREFADAPAQA
jgi:hypothetical protein